MRRERRKKAEGRGGRERKKEETRRERKSEEKNVDTDRHDILHKNERYHIIFFQIYEIAQNKK